MKERFRQTTRRPALLLAALLIGITPMGTLVATAEAASGHAAAKHSKKHSSKKKKKSKKKGGCHIPQGNVKDNDSDNHGGPSDGDGCM